MRVGGTLRTELDKNLEAYQKWTLYIDVVMENKTLWKALNASAHTTDKNTNVL